jgi:hypothetical protein
VTRKPAKATKKTRRASTMSRKIDAALNQAAMDAVDAHKKAGQPLVVWQNGQTTMVPADAILPARNGRGNRRPKK